VTHLLQKTYAWPRLYNPVGSSTLSSTTSAVAALEDFAPQFLALEQDLILLLARLKHLYVDGGHKGKKWLGKVLK
jgi:hypothetical protein